MKETITRSATYAELFDFNEIEYSCDKCYDFIDILSSSCAKKIKSNKEKTKRN